MTRRTRTFAVLLTAGALTLPAGTAAAGCTSSLPATNDRAMNHTCTGAHPGMGLTVPSKKWGESSCTAGFAFADQYKNRYLTIPGTCHLDYECLEDTVTNELPPPLDELVQPPTCLLPSDSEEEPFYKRGGPVVTDLSGDRVGVIVYAVNKEDVNFALIRVDRRVRLDPAVPFYGGPVRMAAPVRQPEEAYAYSAPAFPGAPNVRSGVLHALGGGMYHLAEGFTSVSMGTPVVKPDGSGMGYYGHGFTAGFGWRVDEYGPAIRRAADRTKLRLRLLTAPVTPR
ncbi:MAG TPA: hypothetical protein VNA14_11930 [Mycobacteriales bacterium]|nr:hypothetical protein [Mycobacteriales bacterium]